MSRKEVPRAGLVKAALAGQITNAQGAEALRLSVRQFQRLKRRFQRAGPRGLLHAARGRPSPRALTRALRNRVAALLQTVSRDVNDCHATEKLREVEGLCLSRESVRRIRRASASRPSTAAAPASTASAGPAPPAWAPSSSSTAVRTTGSKAGGRR
jgi:hypothetical protein